ncbi:MAG: hypothetical protein GY714_05325, partial [Desulfobacterales bacterium]|nr:hypothetical protein [Desulfobacterales bacterium]
MDYILNEEKIKKQEYDPAKDKKLQYHGNEQTYILKIMIKFELCYLYDNKNRLYIIPNLLPQELTPEPELPQTSDLLHFIFEYDYMPANCHIIERVAKSFLWNDLGLYWLTGKDTNITGRVPLTPHWKVRRIIKREGHPGLYFGDYA